MTGNPLVYEDCNKAGDKNTQYEIYLATHLSTRIATKAPESVLIMDLPGNPLVYEDCNCKIFVICECYSTKDLLSYGGKCKKYLHGAKALDLIPITFYYRTNSP